MEWDSRKWTRESKSESERSVHYNTVFFLDKAPLLVCVEFYGNAMKIF